MELTDALLAELNGVSDRTDLAECMRKLWILSDRPSYRTLSARANKNRQSLSKTVIGQILGGHSFPRRAVLTAFLTACGLAPDEHIEWERAWSRVAPLYHGTKERRGRRPDALVPSVTPIAGTGGPDGPADPGERRQEALVAIETLRTNLTRMRSQVADLDSQLDVLRELMSHAGARPDRPPRDPGTLSSLVSAEWWSESSVDGLVTPVGFDNLDAAVEIRLADRPPHGVIGGPSGAGKTNVIYAILAGLCTRYSPRELELYLLDFKEGVSFNRFAPDLAHQSWLPHARLVGININSDPEFGIALLRHLHWELKRRATAAKRLDATSISELRGRDQHGYWPRMLAVVDEFQVLLAGRTMYSQEAADLLEDIARRGRAMGIHMILASQEISGIESLWGRPALVNQLGLRIALPKARRVLADTNMAADTIPKNHAVVNLDSGAADANQIVRVPMASDAGEWSELRRRLWSMRSPDADPPVVFDGDLVPRLANVRAFRFLNPGSQADPVAAVGHAMDVMDRPAFVRLQRRVSRNIAILGNREDLVRAVIQSSVASLCRQFAEGAARFSLVCLDDNSHHYALPLRKSLGRSDVDVYGKRDLREVLKFALQGSGPHFLVLYAADTISSRYTSDADPSEDDGSAGSYLRAVMNNGPERGIHVIGWWRRPSSFRETAGLGRPWQELASSVVVAGARPEEVSYLDVRARGFPIPDRRNRAFLFDVDQVPSYQTIVPYGL